MFAARWSAVLIITDDLSSTVNYKAATVVGTSHLGGKTSKCDTRNAHVWRHFKTRFVRQLASHAVAFRGLVLPPPHNRLLSPSATFLSAVKPITENLLKSGRLSLTSERLSREQWKTWRRRPSLRELWHRVPYVQNQLTAIKEFVTGNSDIFVNLPSGYAKSL